MRRNAKWLFLALFVLALLARVVRIFLPGMHGPDGTKPAHEAELQYAQGDVVRVDQSVRQLVLHPVITGSAEDLFFQLEPGTTRVRLGTNELRIEDIQPGDHAMVSYKKPGGNDAPKIASEVRLARSNGAH